MEYKFDKLDFQVLAKVWTWRFEDKKLVIPEINKAGADNLLDKAGERLAVLAEKLGLKMALIKFPGANRGYEILTSLTNTDDAVNDCACTDLILSISSGHSNEDQSRSVPLNTPIDNDTDLMLSLPEQELNESLLVDSSLPTYVNSIFDQENLFANSAALAAQGQKPKFLGQTAYALNDVDELDRRCNFLMNGEFLKEYEYLAWRWYFDQDANRWRLKRMSFVSNFRRVDSINLGRHLQVKDTPCWLGQVLRADELLQRMA